jgi:hypothetical protein
MLNLPPPSTRLPGAPPPPVLPPRPYEAPVDSAVHPRLPPQDETISENPENDPDRQPQLSNYRHEPLSPDWQTKDVPPSYQSQDAHHEKALLLSDRISHAPASDDLQENAREERPTRTTHEERRPKVTSETIPASWDRPRDIAPPPARKPLTLPASLPPKPVAALGDLNLQQSSTLRTGHQSRGRRSQQQQQVTEESNSHGTRWSSGPRGNGNRDKEREKKRWGGGPEYQGPSLLARMSSHEPVERELVEIAERGGGEVQRKRARTRKYQGV